MLFIHDYELVSHHGLVCPWAQRGLSEWVFMFYLLYQVVLSVSHPCLSFSLVLYFSKEERLFTNQIFFPNLFFSNKVCCCFDCFVYLNIIFFLADLSSSTASFAKSTAMLSKSIFVYTDLQ